MFRRYEGIRPLLNLKLYFSVEVPLSVFKFLSIKIWFLGCCFQSITSKRLGQFWRRHYSRYSMFLFEQNESSVTLNYISADKILNSTISVWLISCQYFQYRVSFCVFLSCFLFSGTFLIFLIHIQLTKLINPFQVNIPFLFPRKHQ